MSIFPLETLHDAKEVFSQVNEDSASLFSELRKFFIGIARETADFRKMMTPYIDYFYPP